ncbi:MAG: PilZ domain-containing protein [Phycisphaerae bacterium]|nr:PilZ domain-containing protein [Phycisphaerae bacterium]
MQAVIDLTPRQARRVLEQALRGGADLEIEPRTRPEDEPLHGRIIGQDGNLLRVDLVEGAPRLPVATLLGAFCDVRMVLSGQLYLFSTCVVDVLDTHSPVRLLLAVPDTIHVANRRRFERRTLSEFTQVRLWPQGSKTPYICELCNISGDGLACRMVRGELEELLLVGDEVRVRFGMMSSGEVFELQSVVCNKSVTHDRTQLIVGVEFRSSPADQQTTDAVRRLRTALCELATNLPEMDGEA